MHGQCQHTNIVCVFYCEGGALLCHTMSMSTHCILTYEHLQSCMIRAADGHLPYGNTGDKVEALQALRQAVNTVQQRTHSLDVELAKAQKHSVTSAVRHAEMQLELESVTAQLKSCRACKADLEKTISKVGFSTVVGPSINSLRTADVFHTSHSECVAGCTPVQILRSACINTKADQVSTSVLYTRSSMSPVTSHRSVSYSQPVPAV